MADPPAQNEQTDRRGGRAHPTRRTRRAPGSFAQRRKRIDLRTDPFERGFCERNVEGGAEGKTACRQSVETRAQIGLDVEPRLDRAALSLVELIVEISDKAAIVGFVDHFAFPRAEAAPLSAGRNLPSANRAAARRLMIVPIGVPRNSAASL